MGQPAKLSAVSPCYQSIDGDLCVSSDTSQLHKLKPLAILRQAAIPPQGRRQVVLWTGVLLNALWLLAWWQGGSALYALFLIIGLSLIGGIIALLGRAWIYAWAKLAQLRKPWAPAARSGRGAVINLFYLSQLACRSY